MISLSLISVTTTVIFCSISSVYCSCDNFTCLYEGLQSGLLMSDNFSSFSHVFILDSKGKPDIVSITADVSWISCDNTSKTLGAAPFKYVWGKSTLVALYGPSQKFFHSILLFNPLVFFLSIIIHEHKLLSRFDSKSNYLELWIVTNSVHISIELNTSLCFEDDSKVDISEDAVRATLLKLLLKSEQLAAGNSAHNASGDTHDYDSPPAHVVHFEDTQVITDILLSIFVLFPLLAIVLIIQVCIYLSKIIVKNYDKPEYKEHLHVASIMISFITFVEIIFKIVIGTKINSISSILALIHLIQSSITIIVLFFLMGIVAFCCCVGVKSESDTKRKKKAISYCTVIANGLYLSSLSLQVVPLLAQLIVSPFETVSLVVHYLIVMMLLIAFVYYIYECCCRCLESQCRCEENHSCSEKINIILTIFVIILILLIATAIALLYSIGVILGSSSSVLITFTLSLVFPMLIAVLRNKVETLTKIWNEFMKVISYRKDKKTSSDQDDRKDKQMSSDHQDDRKDKQMTSDQDDRKDKQTSSDQDDRKDN